jgi:hypothetical protein
MTGSFYPYFLVAPAEATRTAKAAMPGEDIPAADIRVSPNAGVKKLDGSDVDHFLPLLRTKRITLQHHGPLRAAQLKNTIAVLFKPRSSGTARANRLDTSTSYVLLSKSISAKVIVGRII